MISMRSLLSLGVHEKLSEDNWIVGPCKLQILFDLVVKTHTLNSGPPDSSIGRGAAHPGHHQAELFNAGSFAIDDPNHLAIEHDCDAVG